MFTFDQFATLVELQASVKATDNTVYVPDDADVCNARDLVPGSTSVTHEAFTMFHRAAAGKMVEAFSDLLEEFADGDPLGAVCNLSNKVASINHLVQQWAEFTRDNQHILSPGCH